MKSLHEQRPKLPPLDLRNALITIHTDLFTIHSKIRPYLIYFPVQLTNLEKLVLVLEDRRFFRHQGIDLISLAREVLRAITFRRHGGASTIDMQLIRTSTGYRAHTFKRKAYEMLLAWLIQFRYSKIVILRSYLACAFFGSRLRGAEVAARKMFAKAATDLSIDEAAIVAAMLVYPKPLQPTNKWQSRLDRRAEYGKRVYIARKERFDQMPD